MPSLSLVVCVYRQRDLLERLLRNTANCYDDLVVVHDGREPAPPSEQCPAEIDPIATDFADAPDVSLPGAYEAVRESPRPDSVHDVVATHHGKFFQHPRVGSLEGQSPFAWSQAKHDWILRLDADELPSRELQDWLRSFRNVPEPSAEVSGYTCIWPLWNGQKMISQHWPAGRIFLFNRNRVRFFGMIEQVPIADGHFESVPLVLGHRPARKSYGLHNLLVRRQAYRWRRVIAHSLLGKPTDLPRWRWSEEEWPQVWEEIRRQPLRTGFRRLVVWPLRSFRDFWRHERKFLPAAAVSGGIHHFLIAIEHWRARRSITKK